MFERIETLPQDIINHIAKYVTKQMKLQWRIHKLYTKVEELDKRTIDEWIDHIKFSKRYSVTIIKIDQIVKYINIYRDNVTIHKNELIDQGYVYHIRHLYQMYIDRIVRQSTPAPKYVGETFTNILGVKMTANKNFGCNDYNLLFTE